MVVTSECFLFHFGTRLSLFCSSFQSMMKEKRPALTDMTPKNITTKSSSVKKRSSVPKGTPARQCWHVTRDCVIKRVVKIVIEGIRGRDGSGGVGVGGHEGRRVVGLVGESGSGTTTAASELVRRSVVRELFPDGIVWLNVGNGAKGRLRCLMHDLASMVHEVVGGGKGKPPPADSFSCEGYSSAAYIKEMVTTTAAVATKGQGHGHRRCLLVADDVWDAEVISELRATGMWILVTTHREDLIKGAKGETVRVEKLSQDDAEAVLRRASGIPAGMHLPEAARDLSELCGYVAMDVAFVGRWNTVCGRGDRLAWSDAAASIRMELDAQNYDDAVTTTGGGAPRMKLRAAVLRAGFDELSAEGYLVQWLYMALAVMPDAHAFSVMDAAALLYDSECEIDDLEPIKSVVDTLERWSILRADGSPSAVLDMTQGWWRTHKYRMHAAHCMFARENLVDRVDVLGPAVRRWVRHISSPEAVHEISPIVLVELWRAVKCVAGGGGGGGSGEGGGESGCRVVDIDPSCGSYTSGGDGDGGGGWGGVEKADSAEVIKKWGAGGVQHELLHLHPEKMIVHGQQPKRASSSSNNKTNNNTICSLAVQSALRATQFHLDRDDWDCAFAMWTRALDWMHTEKSDTDEAVTPTTSSATAELVFEKLVELGWCVWVAGREEEAVELVNRGAVMGEAKLGPGAVNDVLMSKGSPRLGAKFCGRHEQSSGGRRREALLTRVLEIRVVKPLSSPPPPLTKLMPETGAQTVSTTLHQLACGVWDNGRCEEGISLLRRALEMVEGNRVMMATTAGWEKGEVKDEGFSSNVVKMRQQLDRWIQETEGTE